MAFTHRPVLVAALLAVAHAAVAAPPGMRWSTSTAGSNSPSGAESHLALDAAGNAFISATSSESGTNRQCINVSKHAAATGATLWLRATCDMAANAQSVAVDAAGDLYSVGHLAGDFVVMKHSGRDGAILWQKAHNGPANGYDAARTVVVDASGDVIVAGVVAATTARDGKVIKYRAGDGAVVWEATLDNGDDDDFYVSAVGSDGSIAVGTRTYVSGGPRWGVAKLRPDGSLAWKKTVGGDGAPSAIAMADDGTVYVAGSFRVSEFSTDLQVYRLSSGAGEPEWQRVFSTVGNDYAGRIRLDGQGALFFTGGSADQFLTARLSPSTGASVWEARFQAEFRGDESGNDIAFDAVGDVIVTGSAFYQGNVSQSRTIKYSRESGAIAWMRVERSTNTSHGDNVVVRDEAIYLLASSFSFPGSVYLTRLDASTSAPAANVHGLWWNAPADSESGWGVNFAQQGDIIFATFFSYDADNTATWLVGPDTRKVGDNLYKGKLYKTTGPAFSAVPFDPAKVVATEVGTLTLEFDDNGNGVFHFTVGNRRTSKPITRQVFAALPTCSPSTAARGNNYQDLWWRAPAGSESGWGINLTHQGDVLFATWFTYDAAGKPMWLVGPNVARVGSEQRFTGPLYRTRGPYYFDNFDPSKRTNEQVGTIMLTFANPEQGTLEYIVDGIAQSKAIIRQDFGAPRTICH